jgi:hypothetical protein
MIEIVEVLALAKLSMLPVSTLVRKHAVTVAILRATENLEDCTPIHTRGLIGGLGVQDAWDEHGAVARFPRIKYAIKMVGHGDAPHMR